MTPAAHASEDMVAAANRAFYDAHEGRDVAAMSSIWEHSARVVCIHPGWPILRGWDDVLQSWAGIFRGPGRNQFIVTNEAIVVVDDVAWVTLDENMMSAEGTGTVAATNVFVRSAADPVRWLLVAHHGSPVMSS